MLPETHDEILVRCPRCGIQFQPNEPMVSEFSHYVAETLLLAEDCNNHTRWPAVREDSATPC